MSDHTDDGFPRERYEGPMASVANGNSLKNSKSSVETRGCEACGGTGFFDARHSDRFCPTCEGIGTAPNGSSPENPESSVDVPEPTVNESIERLERLLYNDTAFALPDWACEASRQIIAANRMQVEKLVALDGERRELEATIAEQAAEIEKLKQSCTEFLRSIASQETDINHRDARINEQAAEIERLRGELNERGEALTMAEMSLMETDEEVKGLRADRDNWKKLFTDHLAVESQLRAKLAEATLIDAPELRTERDTLRLENQRLKDLSFEAQDRYAALEAERDGLKRKLVEANTRAEKYLAVIAAQSDMIEEQERHNEIALRLSQAYSVAGFATDVLQVGDVPRVKEADNA